MPRGPRLDAEDALHHVMARGIEKRDLFRNDADRTDFISRIEVLVPETGTAVYAWSLMPNHFHLLLRSGWAGLSAFMRRLQTGYAVAFNRRHRRTGHVFENRFKSILIQEDAYLLELVRYIHLNPLRANLVRDMRGLDGYPWSGHVVLLGRRDAEWQSVNPVLQQFGRTTTQAVRAYRQFVSDGVAMGRRPELASGRIASGSEGRRKQSSTRLFRDRRHTDDRVLGSEAFATDVVKQARRRLDFVLDGNGIESALEGLLDEVCRELEVSAEEVRGEGRKRAVAQAREMIADEAVRELRVPSIAVARFLRVSPSAVSQMATRTRNRAARAKKLRR